MSILGEATLGAPSATGVEFRIDWFAVTFHGATFEEVAERLRSSLGDDWREDAWSRVLQDDTRMFKVMGPHDTYLEKDRFLNYVHVCLKGRQCGEVGTAKLVQLAKDCTAWLGELFVARRIDVAWDDHSRRMTPAEFEERLWKPAGFRLRPEVRSRARKGCLHSNRGDARGACCELGTRSSLRMLRYYDKEAQSAGAVKAMRMELQTRDRAADKLLRDMVRSRSESDAVAAAASHLVSFVDFREPEDPSRRLPWWSKWVGGASKATIGGRPESSLVRFLAQTLNQFPGTFSVLVEACGSPARAADVLLSRVQESPKNPRHRRHIELLRGKNLTRQERIDLGHLGILC